MLAEQSKVQHLHRCNGILFQEKVLHRKMQDGLECRCTELQHLYRQKKVSETWVITLLTPSEC